MHVHVGFVAGAPSLILNMEVLMTRRAWAIKLGSGGRHVRFCEDRRIVGVGWRDVQPNVLLNADRDGLRAHVRDVCEWYESERDLGGAVGQLHRFARECRVGDLVAYYDPPRKRVSIVRVTSELLYRNEPQDSDDIWHYRKVEPACPPISILDFDGVLT